MIMKRNRQPAAALVGIAALWVFGAGAQDYPVKTIRIVATEAGGGTDFSSRILARALPAGLGRPVIVENRAAILATEGVARAAPDGYTVLATANSAWLLPFLRKSISWDPVKDFAPVSLVNSAPNIVSVHPSLPVKNVRDLIALSKARPGQLNYGSALGNSTHLSAELFKAMAGVNWVHIPYRGNSIAMIDLMSGQIQIMFPSFGAALSHAKSGRLRALAVTSARPSPQLPDVPTVGATLKGYQSGVAFGILAPAGTPAPVVRRLHQEIVKALSTPEVKDQFLNGGLEIIGSSPEEFAAFIRDDMKKMGKVIQDAGIREQ
jgi:tripartite-type tricarboxylate transporter receptor subunit TctC